MFAFGDTWTSAVFWLSCRPASCISRAGANLTTNDGVQLLCKRRSHTHEREVRALFCVPPQDAKTGRGIGVPVDLPKLIERIVVSPEYPRWAVPALQDAVTRAGVMLKIEPSDLLRRPDLDALRARGGALGK
jgi:hypothetical protein